MTVTLTTTRSLLRSSRPSPQSTRSGRSIRRAAEPHVLAELVEGVEQLRRMVDATATDVAHVIDVSNPFRSQGYRNARTLLEQRAQLSGPEAHRRIQTARMREQLPEWAGTARNGTVGVAQSESMARVAGNPRIDPDELLRDAGLLLDDAIDLPYEEFERNLRRWGGPRRPRRRLDLTGLLPELAGVNSPESSPGMSTPNGESTGPTPATGSATWRHKPTWSEPKHSAEPSRRLDRHGPSLRQPRP